MTNYCVKVVGVTFENRQETIALIREGDDVMLRPESTNPHDPNAVMVLWRGKHIGYIARDTASEISPRMGGNMVHGWVSREISGTGGAPTLGLEITFAIGG